MAVQEIGIPLDPSRGTYHNIVYKDGKLQLAERGVDGEGRAVYADFGYWESEIITIKDKVKAFKNIAKTVEAVGNASYKIYTKTSEDRVNWTDYVEASPDDSINSLPASFVKVKIEIYPEKIDADFYVDKFEEGGRYDNDFVSSDQGVLKLKRQYDYNMNLLQGSIFTTTVPNSNFKKIDRIRVFNRE
ncbi:hypothetical protein PAE9249_05127 [Paenibacillus sp. CECT 9249]|uniref:hypothetical protein n=1 Tax=Paenibacillus sp. CECT 9249 TaxID=2845385 RepID=UPI001E33F8BB|nr:hypothetical protein [Paenibacillus sp. CECT 9249]CAH0122555.1 hypothetical protein PAE9249_05127 [Paenibacillus sp. CECT 9249]